MKRIRLFGLSSLLMFALAAGAQQANADHNANAGQGTTTSGDGVPSVEGQLKLLSNALALNADQTGEVKAILVELHNTTEKAVTDKHLSDDERMADVRAGRYKADAKIRVVLSDEQKKKLDQVEQEPHPELHGNVNAAAEATKPSPQNQ